MKQLTMLEFSGADFDDAKLIARRKGFGDSTAYTSTSDIVGLFCLPKRAGQQSGCVIKTEEFGFMFVQDIGDMHIEANR